jgi:hypothetical protein
MRTTIEGRGKNAAEFSSLEAEVEAWRANRALRAVSMTGKVPVVRIRRRVRPALWSGPSADRALAATTR